jgi:hypothetical protein
MLNCLNIFGIKIERNKSVYLYPHSNQQFKALKESPSDKQIWISIYQLLKCHKKSTLIMINKIPEDRKTINTGKFMSLIEKFANLNNPESNSLNLQLLLRPPNFQLKALWMIMISSIASSMHQYKHSQSWSHLDRNQSHLEISSKKGISEELALVQILSLLKPNNSIISSDLTSEEGPSLSRNLFSRAVSG